MNLNLIKQTRDYLKAKANVTSHKLAKSEKGSELVEKIIMNTYDVPEFLMINAGKKTADAGVRPDQGFVSLFNGAVLEHADAQGADAGRTLVRGLKINRGDVHQRSWI